MPSISSQRQSCQGAVGHPATRLQIFASSRAAMAGGREHMKVRGGVPRSRLRRRAEQHRRCHTHMVGAVDGPHMAGNGTHHGRKGQL